MSEQDRESQKFIPVAEPSLDGREKEYVMECLESGWISGSGKYIDRFEESFARFCNARHGVAVANGTVALHVALLALGITAGDEVIVPDLTYIAAANSVLYCNAKPVFADVDPVTWTLNPAEVERKITPRTRAIIAVHLYGHPVEMGQIQKLAKNHKLFIIEDAAEAHGAEYKGRRIGSIGDIATFSFYGNKIITTGEGGMIVTNDDTLARQSRLLKGQGMDPERRYWFPMLGYNYRMTNIQAAIGLAQLERIDWLIERRREVAAWYAEMLGDMPAVVGAVEAEWAKNVYWLYSVCVEGGFDRDLVMREMGEQCIETRPFFPPMHQMPPHRDEAVTDETLPVATSLAARGINLPSSARLTKDDVRRIARALQSCLRRQAKKGMRVD